MSKLGQCRHRQLWPKMRLRCAVELMAVRMNMEFVTMTTMFLNSPSDSNDVIMETTQQQLHSCKQAVCSNKYSKMWN